MLKRPFTVDFVSIIPHAALILDLVPSASIILLKSDAAILVYFPLDLECAVFIGALALDLVALGFELLECHGAPPAVMLDIVSTPDRPLLELLRLLRGHLRKNLIDVYRGAGGAVSTLGVAYRRMDHMGECGLLGHVRGQ